MAKGHADLTSKAITPQAVRGLEWGEGRLITLGEDSESVRVQLGSVIAVVDRHKPHKDSNGWSYAVHVEKADGVRHILPADMTLTGPVDMKDRTAIMNTLQNGEAVEPLPLEAPEPWVAKVLGYIRQGYNPHLPPALPSR